MESTRSLFLGLATLALLLATACRPSTTAVVPKVAGPAAPLTPAEITRAGAGLLEQYRQAHEVRSASGLAQIYAHGLDLVVVHQGMAMLGWTAVETRLKQLLSRAVEIHITTSDVSVVALGKAAAAVTARVAREINDGTSTVLERGILTLTLQRRDGTWLIVSEHFSYPPR